MAETEQSDKLVRVIVLVLSAITLVPVLATPFIAVKTLATMTDWTKSAAPFGALVGSAGLSAVVICLVLRLRYFRNDLVTPPSLVGPIVVVLIGAALVLGAVVFAYYP